MKYLLIILPMLALWLCWMFQNTDEESLHSKELNKLYENIVRYGEVPYDYEIIVECTENYYYEYIMYSDLYKRDSSPLNVHYVGSILGARIYVYKEVYAYGSPTDFVIGRKKREVTEDE